jgi:[protein-PII] uridylyltransferase
VDFPAGTRVAVIEADSNFEVTAVQAKIKQHSYENAVARLQKRRDDLIVSYQKGAVTGFIERHTRILDEYFREQFENSEVGPRIGINQNPYAFIALGGYGRGEQCVHSDIDLLFLFQKKVSRAAEDLIREIVYPLWDIGMDVGYATRTLKECLGLAAKDYETLTPLLDARFVCGMSPLYSDLKEQLHRKVLARKSGRVVNWLIESNRQRHLQYGDSTYRLEPNLKEGEGGLRDYHTILWLARIQYKFEHRRDLEYFGKLSHDEYRRLSKALQFIWHVRNRLHLLCGRKCDQLHFENQLRLAELLKYKKTNGLQPVEHFLGVLHGHMEFIKQQHLRFVYELGYATSGKPRKRTPKKTRVDGLAVNREMLDFDAPEMVLEHPDLLIQIFQESLRLKIPLSAEAKRVVQEFGYLIDEDFANASETVKSFERILVSPAPTFNVLREMLNTGFLQRFIPAFKEVANRIQYDEYHLYPVDKHLLRTVQTLKNFGQSESEIERLYVKIYKELKNRKPLFWAALLHDIGKGTGEDDHSTSGGRLAEDILTDKGLRRKDVETVRFLVEKHLLLIKTATRRDIHDEETAIRCAREIVDPERLKMLYLLTVADCMSTGPNAWNDWTASLLRDFFFKVLNICEKGELASQEAVAGAKSKVSRVLESAESDQERAEVAPILEVLSPRYLIYATSDQILEDIRRYRRLGEKTFVWDITRSAHSDTRTVKICAKDRPGLFSKIAGVFTLNNIDIVDAQIFTWRNQIAMDIFEVKPPPDQLFEEERWVRASDNLTAALDGTLDLAAALHRKLAGVRRRKRPPNRRPHRIVVDNKSSSFFTIVEVFTDDYPGLLFNITDALYRCQLDVWVAKIATKVDQVVDVFYVRDFDGQKVDRPDQEKEIRAAIGERLVPKAASQSKGGR